MTTSILNDCLLLRNLPIEKLREYLSSINVTIFDNLIEKYKEEATQIILYILCAYDEQSPLVIARQDSLAEQNGICEYLNIPEFKRTDLINLKEHYIRSAVTEYVTQFAGATFRSLALKKIQLRDLELAITNREYYTEVPGKAEEEGEEKKVIFKYDWKEHGLAIRQHNQLAKDIEIHEKEYKDRAKRMEGIEDLKSYSREGIETGKLKVTRKGNIEGFIK